MQRNDHAITASCVEDLNKVKTPLYARRRYSPKGQQMPKKELFDYTYFNLKEYLCFCQKNCIKGHKTISPFCFYGMEIHHILNLWRGCNLSSLKKSESKKILTGTLGWLFVIYITTGDYVIIRKVIN